MTNLDLPPAYNSLHTSTVNVSASEEEVPICQNDDEPVVSSSFEDKTDRLIFIQKVLTVKLLQLMGVTMIMMLFVGDNNYCRSTYNFMNYGINYVHLFILSTIAYAVTFGLLVYYEKARRTNPYRYIFLVAYPLSYTFLICFIMIWHQITEIAAAWAYYCMAVLALLVYSIFASQSKLEFCTKHGAVLSTLVLIVMYAITVPLLYHADAFYILYPTIVVGLDLVFILFNIEIMTYKHYRTVITPADFVDGAINLHVDVYYTFVNAIVPTVKSVFGKLFGPLTIDE